ncbi:hypothetical protein ACSFA3_07860 [Variovorax sp. RHLX14]|uniref:hypothetical protein n=1 Tax=Variovorax sp. RHLX14 TaxID=1259731 RepID=UPI003F47827B
MPASSADSASTAGTGGGNLTPVNSRVEMQRLGLLSETLRHFGMNVNQFTNLERVGAKMGGSRDVSGSGGMYRNQQGQQMLLKQPVKPQEAMAEFFNGALNRSFTPDGVQVLPLRQNGSTYLASVFPDRAVDLYKYAYQAAGQTPPPERPVVHLGNKATTATIDDGFRLCQGRGLEENLALRHLIGDNDVHSGNFVVQPDADGRVDRVIGIDYGWGSRETSLMGVKVGNHFGSEVHPNSVSRRLPIVGPTNHHVDIPPEVRSGVPYIDQLLRSAQHDFQPAIHGAFQQAGQSWAPSVFGAFARNAGLDLPRGQIPTGPAVEQAYAQRIEERQTSMLDYAAGMASGLAHLEQSNGLYGEQVVLDVGPTGLPLVDRYLIQPDIGRRIGDYAAGLSTAPKMRNHALEGHEDELRFLLAQRFQTVPYEQQAAPSTMPLQPQAGMQPIPIPIPIPQPVMATQIVQPAAVPSDVPSAPGWQSVPTTLQDIGGVQGEEVTTIRL